MAATAMYGANNQNQATSSMFAGNNQAIVNYSGMPYKPPRMPTSKPPSRKMDKSKDSCYACNGVGHWAGDPACPFMQAPGQPHPPGTEL